MIFELILVCSFLLSTFIYWYVHLTTGILSTRYFLQILLLALSATSGVWLSIILLEGQPSVLRIAIAIAILFIALLAIVLIVIKLFLRPGDRMRSMGELSRSFTRFGRPIRRFKLKTEDNVTIQAVQVVNDPPHEKAVIVCHGGGRSKDIHAVVITCELLAEQYDVFTFDSRGHQESGGYWTGDGDSKYDLKAMIHRVRAMGYEKIGVVGWSFGAWTAIIAGAEFKNFDTLVAAAPPPTDMREVDMAKSLFAVVLKWWGWPTRVLLKVIRNFRVRPYDFDLSLEAVIADLSPIPLLLVCNEFDTAMGLPQERFQQLFDKAGPPKEFVVLKGRGHIYDWPNTFHYLNLVQDWLEKTL